MSQNEYQSRQCSKKKQCLSKYISLPRACVRRSFPNEAAPLAQELTGAAFYLGTGDEQ